MKNKFITKIAENLVYSLQEMKDSELKKVIKECNSLTSSNCWWIEYHLKDAVLECAENQLRLNKEKKIKEKNERRKIKTKI